ncbi:cupin domain-containing protein [Streptomyces sp. CBMA29]|uniref:cupin domain-containing protein n=1 Tax=Streptomyces sp. CBMA29 TaxID=1896314 RepID=UPI0016618D05|nr:cupin domain-containing protein [Streptomyces sp. CBMA29]MBD0736322.1 cupin [Streptomyces sp. CBMA29]
MGLRPRTAHELGLEPHPEGGWYGRVYSSPVEVAVPGLDGVRPTATLIHYLLSPGERSAWHRVRSDELWLWRRGGQLLLRQGGTGDAPQESGASASTTLLGPGHDHPVTHLQALVPAGTWQSAEPAQKHEVLVSCLVTPGFSFADFELYEDSAARAGN